MSTSHPWHPAALDTAKTRSIMLIALFTLLISALSWWMAYFVARSLRDAKTWPTTQGHILERGVGEPMGMGRAYLPLVKYTYDVNGTTHTNDQVYVIRRTGQLASAVRKTVNALPDPVTVHYNPIDPGQSFLLFNPMSTVWLLIACAIGAGVLGAADTMLVFMK